MIDASALLEILLQTPAAEGIDRSLLRHGGRVCAPHLIDLEIAQVLRRYGAARVISRERGTQAIQDLADFPLQRYPHQPLLNRIWELRGNLTAYDAAYVVLAEALDTSLVTCDRALAAAPGLRVKLDLVKGSS